MSVSPDDYRDSSSFNSGIYLPLLIGLVGAVIGAIGIVLALRAQSAAEQASEAFGSRDRLAAELKEVVDDLNARMVTLTARVQQQESTGARVPDQVRAAINTLDQKQQQAENNLNLLASRFREIGTHLEELDRRTTELAATRAPVRSTTPSTTAASSSTPAPSSGTEAGGQEDRPSVYQIRSGDNFTNIARRYKVSTNDLIQANPGVDPQRLQIGQEIRIP